MKEDHKKAAQVIVKATAPFAICLIIVVVMRYFNLDMFQWLLLGIAIAGVSAGLMSLKLMDRKVAGATGVFFISVSLIFLFYIYPSGYIAQSGTVLNDNWFEALKWINENTPECSTVATYWDPGHFIRAIGNRTVVFDGGSQNHLFQINESGPDGLTIENYDNGITHLVQHKNGIRTTARIQDISTTLMTSNESLAVDILKDYRKSGCDEIYYIASADLMSKSAWWTYFATWAPNKNGNCRVGGITEPKGDCYSYSLLSLSGATPNGESIIYTYSAGQNQAFLLNYDPQQDRLQAYLSENNNLFRIKQTFYFTKDGSGVLYTVPDAEVPGTVWADTTRNIIIYMPPQIENAVYTKLMLYNGVGLEKFEFVKDWGSEIKLYKVKIEE
ncbi:MAG: hypothetical protein HY364_03030 [Candidatus Aenigmarchaeota archaeon]|nr:hypothetical protein [Candidatus Aenigmarchaeota archaeon]